MTFTVVRYEPSRHEALWDRWCSAAANVNATFLHTRRFLGYHKDRFDDRSVLLYQSDRLSAVVPAAVSMLARDVVDSHPGATYGGVVHAGDLGGARMIEAMDALKRHYGEQGFKTLLYKPMPWHFASMPSGDDVYALFRHDARRIGCNLACVVDLLSPGPRSERRRRGLRKALRTATVVEDMALLGEVWDIIVENLARKHDARPVHSLDEVAELAALFPESIKLRAARVEGRLEAGVVLFNTPRVWRAQYIGSSDVGYSISALDAVFDDAIAAAGSAGARYFDFGTSNAEAGRVLNDGLFRFKAEFGGGGVVHEIYALSL